MRRIVRFYNDIQYSEKEEDRFYKYSAIVDKWTDFQFQVKKNYIKWLFPLDTDSGETNLSKGLIYKFRTNPILRRRVLKAVLRFMSFLGYTIVVENELPVDVKEIKPILREENNVVIGLYNKENYPRITRILTFLNMIQMQDISSIFFLMICRAIKKYPDLKHLIDSSLYLPEWINTQSYISDDKVAQEALLEEELEDWEKIDYDLEPEKIVVNDAWN